MLNRRMPIFISDFLKVDSVSGETTHAPFMEETNFKENVPETNLSFVNNERHLEKKMCCWWTTLTQYGTPPFAEMGGKFFVITTFYCNTPCTGGGSGWQTAEFPATRLCLDCTDWACAVPTSLEALLFQTAHMPSLEGFKGRSHRRLNLHRCNGGVAGSMKSYQGLPF